MAVQLNQRPAVCIPGLAGIAYGVVDLVAALPGDELRGRLWATVTVSTGYAFDYVSEKTKSDASSGVGLGLLAAFLGLVVAPEPPNRAGTGAK